MFKIGQIVNTPQGSGTIISDLGGGVWEVEVNGEWLTFYESELN